MLETLPVFGFAKGAVKIHSDPLTFLCISKQVIISQRKSFCVRYGYLGFAGKGLFKGIEHRGVATLEERQP